MLRETWQLSRVRDMGALSDYLLPCFFFNKILNHWVNKFLFY